MTRPNDDDEYDYFIEDLLDRACVGSLDHLVRMLTYDPIAEVWDQFGSLESFSRSPRRGEHGYYVICAYSHDFCLSFQLPFDRDGHLAGCGRVVLETREEELETRVLSWDTSCAIWEELADEIADRVGNLPPFPALSDSCCEPDHRLLVALQDKGVREETETGPSAH